MRSLQFLGIFDLFDKLGIFLSLSALCQRGRGQAVTTFLANLKFKGYLILKLRITNYELRMKELPIRILFLLERLLLIA